MIMAKHTAKSQSNEIEQAGPARVEPQRGWILARPVVALTGLCVRHPVACLTCAVVMTLASLFFAFCYLEPTPAAFRQELNQKSFAAQLALEYKNEVANPVEGCLVVEQRDSSTTEADVRKALSEACSELLARPEFFTVIMGRLDGDSFKTNRPYFFSPEEYRQADELVAIARAIERGDWSSFAVDSYARELARKVQDELTNDDRSSRVEDSALAFSRALVETTTAKAIAPETTPSPVVPGIEAEPPEALSPDPFYTFNSGTALGGGVMFTFVDDLSPEDRLRAVRSIDMIISRTQATNPRTIVEATGLPFLERQELNAFVHAGRAWLVFLVASVVVFFWAFYGSFSRAFVVLATLLTGFVWTLGFQTFAFREASSDNVLNWFTVLCAATNCTAVYLSRYINLRRTDRSASEALMTTAGSSGASIATFATVVSLSSIAFSFTSAASRAFCVMCGVGIALSCLSTLVVMPSLLRIVDGARPFRGRTTAPPFDFNREQTNPYLRTIAIAGLIVAAILSLGLTKLTYDPTRSSFHSRRFENLNSLEAASQYLESRALHGVIFADSPEDARRIAASFVQLEDGAKKSIFVENIAEHLPEVGPDDVMRVEAINDALAALKPEIGEIPIPTREELVVSLDGLRNIVDNAFLSRSGNMEISEYLTRAIEQIASLSDQELEKRLNAFSRLLAHDVLERLFMLRDEVDPHAPCMDDLSDNLKTRYIGQKTGRLILRVYSLRTLSDSRNLMTFVKKLREVDPNATGPAVLTYEQGRQAGRWIDCYLIMQILLFTALAFVRFRNIRASAAALLMPAIALLEIVGVAGLLDISINPINWLVMPALVILTLYAGLRFAEDYEENPELFFTRDNVLSTCVAATTIAAVYVFGLICPESGWQNLGRLGILSAGIFAGAALILIPALLNWSAIQPVEHSALGMDEDYKADEDEEEDD